MTKNDSVKVKDGEVRVFKKKIEAENIHQEQVKRVLEAKIIITNVYSADFSVIDNCLEEIKKETRKHGINEYSCNNIYLQLEETLKKVKLAEK